MQGTRRGFTLVELMVVVAIIGLLATIVAVNVFNQVPKANLARVTADMSSIENAVGLYKLDTGRYPQTLQDLWVRPSNARRWGPDPYLSKRPPKDPWGNEYLYQRTGRQVELISYGADGAPGGVDEDADLSSTALLHEG
jgi:general secretion pathway protein G